MAKVVVVKSRQLLVEPKPEPEPVLVKPIEPVEIIDVDVEEDEDEEPEDEPEEELEPPLTIKTKECSKEDCKKCWRECYTCPYFPLCCNLPLMTALQCIIILDMIVAAITIYYYVTYRQDHPFDGMIGFVKRGEGNSTNNSSGRSVWFVGRSGQETKNVFNSSHNLYVETATVLAPDFDLDVPESDAPRYSKVAYFHLDYQQETEAGCGKRYYVDNLFRYKLNQTRALYDGLLISSCIAEGVQLVVDITFLIATCCHFSNTSARFYLIVIWHSEFIPAVLQLKMYIGMRSQSLCILQYGLGTTIGGLDMMRYFHILPLLTFRAYKSLVFTYFICDMFTADGHLTHSIKVHGMTLEEYTERQKDYHQMTENSSSEEEDA